MERYLVPGTDLRVSRLAYGTAMLGEVDWRTKDLISKSERAISVAYENGINFFDAADIYANGQLEAALGRVLKRSPGFRQKVVIQSKCGLVLRQGWAPGDPVLCDLSYKHIVSAAESSLRRLDTDYLDVLLLHSSFALVQPNEVAEAFDRLHSNGSVRYFGVCAHNVVQLELLRKFVRQPLVVNQIWLGLAQHSSLTDHSGFGGIVDYCRLHSIQVQAYSPLKGRSIFARPMLLCPPGDVCNEVRAVSEMLVAIGREHGVKPAAIMLAWLLRHPAKIVPIIGSTDPQHILESCAADGISLSGEEWQKLLFAAAKL